MPIFKTLLVYVLLGPPVGWLLFGTWLATVASRSEPWLETAGKSAILIVAGIPLSYVIGCIPALAVGTIVALAQNRWASFGLAHVAAIGVACGILFALAFERNTDNPGIDPRTYFIVKVLTCLVPSLICWLIARRWRRPELSEQKQ